MTIAAAWLVGGLLACAAEIIHPGVLLLWIGLAACGTGLGTWWFGPPFEGQVALFIGLTAVLVAVAYWRVRLRKDPVNAPDAGIAGQTCRAVEFQGAAGRVHFRDSYWKAKLVAGTPPAKDARLTVVGLEGTTLLVEAVSAAERTTDGFP